MPKPLSPVGGVPILHRTIAGWLETSAREVIVVTGHRAAELETSVRGAFADAPRLRFVHNPDFALANGVSVLAGADARTADEFIISMSDHLLERAIFETAVAHTPPEDGATLFVDPDVDAVFDIDDATKVQRDDAGRIVQIGKEITTYNCIDIGVFRCTQGLHDSLSRFYAANGDASLSQGVAELAASGRMFVQPVAAVWQDVDDPAMLAHAGEVVASDPGRFPTP